ncbi:MAG: heat-inducible transcriptional repressor HrcA [Candidatus Dormibacteria bacterium]
MIDPRKQQILKAVVSEFTDSGIPVGSQVLERRHFAHLSAATIRNELAFLMEEGYLVQPHTSAGRVPSDRGYRYFVDHLMEEGRVPAKVKRMTDQRLATPILDMQHLVEEVASLLADTTRSASLVTPPRAPHARAKHVDLVGLEGKVALLVLMLEGNVLRQAEVVFEEALDQGELSGIAQCLNAELAGLDSLQARAAAGAPGLTRHRRRATEAVADTLAAHDAVGANPVAHDGVRHLLDQPEFNEVRRVRALVEALEEATYMAGLLQNLVGDRDTQVVIGSENPWAQLQDFSLVITTYGRPGELKGTLGVIGSTRMRYSEMVAATRYVARRAGEAMVQ